MALALLQRHQLKTETLRRCSCLKSLTMIPHLFDYESTPKHNCTKQVFLTNWASNQCQFADLLDPENLKVPMVALLTIPGSGTTWTQSLVQKLTGVLPGSVYMEKDLVDRGIFGETRIRNSTRTSFVKSHLYQFSPKEQSQ